MNRLLRITAIMLFALVAGCNLIEQPYSHYDQYETSIHNGGWVPDVFPHDIVNIHEQHDIDTNNVWLRFTLGKTDFKPEKHGFRMVSQFKFSDTNYAHPSIPIWRRNWWINQPTGQFFEKKVSVGKLEFVLVSPDSNVYWWTQLNYSA